MEQTVRTTDGSADPSVDPCCLLLRSPRLGTFRYRVYNMVQVLNRLSDDVSAAWFCETDAQLLDAVVDCCDVLVICRAFYTSRMDALIGRAKDMRRLVVFDLDDYVFDLDQVQLVLRTIDADRTDPATQDYWYAYFGRIAASLRLCDRITTTNEFLAAEIRRVHQDVRVVPNFLNVEQMEASERIMRAKRASTFARNEEMHLGYFSGTWTHNRDFALVADAVARLMDEDRSIRLRLVGAVASGPALSRHQPRIERHGLQDFVNLQSLVGTTEVNLVPLQENVFTNCKSELKYFEAAIAGTVTVATPTHVFAAAIRDGANGRLAEADEWAEKIHAVIDDLGGSRERYIAMAELCRSDVEERYSWERQLPGIRSALFEAAASAYDGQGPSPGRRYPASVDGGPALAGIPS